MRFVATLAGCVDLGAARLVAGEDLAADGGWDVAGSRRIGVSFAALARSRGVVVALARAGFVGAALARVGAVAAAPFGAVFSLLELRDQGA